MSIGFFNGATQPQFAQPSIRTSEAFSASGTTHNFSLSLTPLVNNRMIFTFSGRNVTGQVANSITQSGATWSRIDSSYAEQADSATEVWISGIVSGTPSTSITVEYTNSNTHTAQYAEIANLRRSSASIVLGAATNTGSSTGLSTGNASITPTRRAFVMGSFSIRNASATPTVFSFPDTNYTTLNDISSGSGTSNIRSAQTYRNITAGQAGLHGTGITADQSAGWAANIIGLGGLTNIPVPNSTISVLQSAQNGVQNATTSIAATFGSVPTSGNTLIAYVARSAGGAISSITQTGATWNLETSAVNGANRIELWIAQAATPSSAIVTANLPVSGSTCIIVAELSGVVSSGDSTLATNTNTGSGTSVSTTTVDGGSIRGFAIAGLQIAQGTNTFSAPTNGYSILTQVNTSGGGAHCASALLIFDQTVVGSTSTAATAATSTGWSSVIALMKGQLYA